MLPYPTGRWILYPPTPRGKTAKSNNKRFLGRRNRKRNFWRTCLTQFKNSIKKFLIHLVTLPSTPTSKLIFNELSLFYIQIKVESYRSNKPVQCFSCQRFEHSSLYCGFAPRCVKYAGPHLAKDCVKTLDTDPKCTDCDGIHTANYTKCSALIAEKPARKPIHPNTQNFPALKNKKFPGQASTQLTSNTAIYQSSSSDLDPSIPSFATVTASNTVNLQPDMDQIIKRFNEFTLNLTKSGENVKQTLIVLILILSLLISLNGQY